MNIPREAIVCSGRHLAAANEITLGKKPAGFGGVCQGCEFERQCRMVQTAPEKDVSYLDTGGTYIQPQADPGGPPLSFDDIPLVMRVEGVLPILRVKKPTVYELIRSGQLRSVRVGNQIRIFKQDLVAFIKQEPAQEPETESHVASK
ncbi:helix-turn-helix domain-containing protein [Lawsonibacter sp. LCP25S3_G6]|uniref:helix-turn-helix domain-containing protein n=1 Tax=unclassified Lawsonibacter TaxID=2617946 RepID=UPI003F98AC68